MKLDLVQIQHFRNIDAVILEPSSSLNFFFGQNGSGKSSLLEAIHYLGFGRSFRTLKHKNVIQHQQDSFSVFCQLSKDALAQKMKLGLMRRKDDTLTVSIDGEKSTRLSNLVSELPVQIFTPQSSDLVLGSPSTRRRFMDWGLFHVEPSFQRISFHYSKLLKNKNAMLRKLKVSGSVAFTEMQFWDNQLDSYGKQLDTLRKNYVEAITPYFNLNLRDLLPEFYAEISYYRGWEVSIGLAEAIEQKHERDCKLGYLSVGPHKADIKIKINGVDAAEILSRGQLRMLVAALQLAQLAYLKDAVNKECIFLLDDIGAELDVVKRELFIDKVLRYDAQLFITAIEKEQLPFIDKYQNTRMFHVEHGQVNEEI